MSCQFLFLSVKLFIPKQKTISGCVPTQLLFEWAFKSFKERYEKISEGIRSPSNKMKKLAKVLDL